MERLTSLHSRGGAGESVLASPLQKAGLSVCGFHYSASPLFVSSLRIQSPMSRLMVVAVSLGAVVVAVALWRRQRIGLVIGLQRLVSADLAGCW